MFLGLGSPREVPQSRKKKQGMGDFLGSQITGGSWGFEASGDAKILEKDLGIEDFSVTEILGFPGI